MNFEATAVLRQWPLEIQMAGETFTIPARPAADWLLAYLEQGYDGVVPGMLAEADHFDDLFMDGAISYQDCVTAARAALGLAAGTRWWSAARLMSTIPSTWVGHRLLVAGVDPAVVPLAAYLAAGYATAQREMKEETLGRFDHELEMPPEGVPVEEFYDEDAAADLFMAAMGGGAPTYDQVAA